MDKKNNYWNLATFWVLITSLLVMGVIVARSFFHYGNSWIKELALLSNTVFVIFGMYYSFKNNRHIAVDILYRRISPKMQRFIFFLGDLLLMLPMFLVILWYSIPYTLFSLKIMEESSEVGGLPAIFLFKSLLILFSGLFVITGIIRIYSYLRGSIGHRKNITD